MSVAINGTGSITGIDQGFNITSGSVGIGTDNPGLTAHIYSTAATDVALIESTQNFATLRFKSALNSSGPTIGIDGAGGLQLDQKDTSKYISFAIGSERLRVDSSGNLLLKTGEIDIQGGNKTVKTSAGFLQVGTSGSHYLSLITAGSQRLNITSGGNVQVNGGNVHIDDNGEFAIFEQNTSLAMTNSSKISMDFASNVARIRSSHNGSAVSRPLAFFIGGSEKLRIASSGEVSIGGFTPGAGAGILQIAGGLRVAGSASASDTTSPYIYRTSGSDHLNFATSGTERLRITSDGELLISNSVNKFLSLDRTNASSGSGEFNLNVESNSQTTVSYDDGAQIVIGTSSSPRTQAGFSEKLRISSSGKVGINYNNPSYMLEVHNSDPGNDSKQLIQRWVNTNQNTLELHMYGGTVDQCQFATTNSEQTLNLLTGVASGNVVSTESSLLLTQNRDGWFQGPNATNYGGGLFIGREASPYGNLCALRDNNRRPLIYMGGAYPEITLAHTVASNAHHGPAIRFATYVQSTNTPTGNQFVIGTNGGGTFLDIGHATAGQNVNVHSGIASYNGTYRFRVTTGGCQVNGSLSKSSGSFRIDHPLAGLSTTRDLVHSFIEGPQADLIYRGVVDLVDGTATVNIDTAGRMTEGTFEVLCTNVSCFTSNETDWTAVKGSVSGNILTITAQDNTSTATVSWMVVGERKDPHMIDTDWTDENGRVITEPLKSS